MKIIKHNKSSISSDDQDQLIKGLPPWKVLVVDDEPDIVTITQINFRDFYFNNRPVKVYGAKSVQDAKEILVQEKGIAVAFIDIVMETDDAGLKLVDYIRNEIGNHMMRVIIRTGQPGVAPKHTVLNNYDIDDYKEKSELTRDKIQSSLRLSIKSYRDLNVIDANRQGMQQIVAITPVLYSYQKKQLPEFFEVVLTQAILIAQCNEPQQGVLVEGAIVSLSNDRFNVHISGNAYSSNKEELVSVNTHKENAINKTLTTHLESFETLQSMDNYLTDNELFIPFSKNKNLFLYLKGLSKLMVDNTNMLLILINQSQTALQNVLLYQQLDESNTKLKKKNKNALHMLAIASEYKDEETGEHLLRICDLTYMLSRRYGLKKKRSKRIADASILHDVGKLGIPDAIIQKPAKLTQEEFAIIKQHTTIGGKILGRDKWFKLAREIAESHHEHWDGNGYPYGLAGENIPLHARIVAVADVYDALINSRPYKDAWSKEQAVSEIIRNKGKHFEPKVVDIFQSLYDEGHL